MFGAVDSIVAYMDGNKGSFLSGYWHVRSHDASDSHFRPIPAYGRFPLTADPAYGRSHLSGSLVSG